MKIREKATDLDRVCPKTPRVPSLSAAVAATASALVATALVAGALFGAVVVAGPSAAAQAQETVPRDATRGGPESTVRALARGFEVIAGPGCARVESAAGSVTAGDCPRRPTDAQDRPSEHRDDSSPEAQPAQGDAPLDGDAERPDRPAGEGCASEGPKGETVAATVRSTTDGDTLEISKRIRGMTTVRLIGVDTPETVDPGEPVEPFGKEASAYTKDALEGRRVRLEIGRDPKDDYGRLLAYLWTEDGMFDEDLLARGYGRLMIIEPNDAYEGCLAAAEQAAKDEVLGLWADGVGRASDEHGDAPETTGVDGSPSPSASPTPRTTPTPHANEESDDGGCLLETFFGGSSDEQSERGADTTIAADDATEAASPQPTTAAARQYAGPDSGQPPARGPEVRDPEIQDPEVQDPEVQDPEVQEPEIQDAASPSPAVSPGASPSASPSALPSASPKASPKASPAPEISLPETGGPSVFQPVLSAIGLASGLLVAAIRVRGRNATPGDGE